MPAEQKSDGQSKELGEIRREVIEARNLVIKTDNLLKNLHAELKAVSNRQEDFQRRSWRSSAMAYALFAFLCVVGAVMFVSARTSSADSERTRLEGQLRDLSAQLERMKAEAATRQQAEREAAEVYRAMTVPAGDERLKGVDMLLKMDTSRLSTLERQALNDRADILRKEVGHAALERGKAAFRRNDMATAVAELSRFVAMNPDQQELVEASFYLGSALNNLRRHDQAIPHLARFVSGDRKAKTREYAMLLLAQSYEQTNQFDKAAETAREALATYPAGEFSGAMRARLNSVKRAQGVGADSPAVQAAIQQAGTPKPAAPAPTAGPPPSPGPAPAAKPATPAPAPTQ